MRNVLLLFLATVLALLIAEAALRAAGVSYPQIRRTHPVFGAAYLPGASGRVRDEGDAFVEINAEGFRDRSHVVAKPAGTYRVAVLGDSFTAGTEVDRDATFPSVVERSLAECGALGGRRPEILNFGCGGYGTAQELLVLREVVWKYAPDLVILAVFTGNDIRNNSKALNRVDYIPYYVLRDGALVLDRSFEDAPAQRRGRLAVVHLLYAAAQHSRLVQIFLRAERAARERLGSSDPVPEPEPFPPGPELYAPPADPSWRDAWAVTEALLSEIAGEVSGHGAEFLVVTLSNEIQVHPDAVLREAARARLGLADFFYPDRRIADLGRVRGFPTITLAPEMADVAARDGTYFHGFGPVLGRGHWNEAGHAFAGRAIAARVCEEIGTSDSGAAEAR
ncbi:MAG: SGNH/GDSL hydrolase family protein [Myxococcales bacterium]|nr:SGNH/GDSL hydrolase family protein [Myxococcales bacterium]